MEEYQSGHLLVSVTYLLIPVGIFPFALRVKGRKINRNNHVLRGRSCDGQDISYQ